MTHTVSDVVRMVTLGVTRHNRGYLVLVAPGFERRPDVASQIERAVRARDGRHVDVVALSADSVSSEEDLVELLVREWCSIDGSTQGRWSALEGEVRDVPPQQRLKIFFRGALVRGRRRVLIVRRFDKAFKCMSGALLAVLRDLEHTDQVTAVNTSVLSYTELYARRATQEPSFVSDYGQSHAALMLGPLGDSEAREEWKESVDRSIDVRLDRAYYSAALEVSGGVPSLFSKAAAYVDAVKGSRDIREYSRLLRRELVRDFRRLIRYDEGDDPGVPTLAESIARIQWGMGTDADVAVVSGHRWGELLLRAGDSEIALRSRTLGACAVDMLGKVPRRLSTEVLYERGEYQACMEQLGSARVERRNPLAIAAEMLSLAFGDSSEPLYFSGEVDWKRVEALAREGMCACEEVVAAEEFGGWVRVAEAMNASAEHGEVLLTKDFVRIGLRLLAVRADRNAITSAYSAIPLVEDAIRTYVVRIHGLQPKGVAFAGLEDEEMEEWWSRGEFTRPNDEARLSGADLVILAAVLSARAGASLFEDAADAMRVVARLGQYRNRLGHSVDTPDKHVSEALADCAERILDAVGEQGDVDLSVRRLENWVKPPRGFLPAR